jgi:autotransporter-associated beta strand protein
MTVLVVVWQLVSPLNLPAANVSWSAGSGTDLLWNTASNWSGSVAPISTDDLIFPGVIPNPGILLSPQVITLSTGSLANSLRFSNSYTLTVGDLNLTSGNITADIGTYSTIASQLTGSTGLTLTGTASSGRGAIRLSNATNSYTGATTINSGMLVIDSNGVLGLDNSTVIINGTNSAGTLMLGGGYTTGFTLARNVQISDGSASGMGNVAVGQSSVTSGIALMSVGSNTLSGSLTSVVGTGSVNTGVASIFGLLTLGNVATGGVAVTNMTTFGSGIVSGSIGNYAITGTLSGAGSVQKAGLGTLILAPTDATGFSGTLRISGGSVRIGSGAVLGTNAGTTTSSTIDLNGNTGAILEVRSDTPAIGKNVYVRSAVTTNSIFADHAVGSSVINQTATFGILAFEQGQTTTFNGRDGYGMTFSTAPVQTATGNSVFTNNLNGPLTFTGAFWSQARMALG